MVSIKMVCEEGHVFSLDFQFRKGVVAVEAVPIDEDADSVEELWRD